MHPNFWLIIICAVIAITIAIVMNKKKKSKEIPGYREKNFSVNWKTAGGGCQRTLKSEQYQREKKACFQDFLYQAVFVPEGVPAPPKSIISQPELQIYITGFGTKKRRCCHLVGRG